MPLAGEDLKLSIVIATVIILMLGMAVITLFTIFQKKNQLNQKEKEIMRATYDKIILQSQLEIQEQTFNVISSELHDNVGQILSLAKVQINIMNERQDQSREMLGEVKDNISKAMNDLRDIARGLSSDRIRMMNLYDTVEEELGRVNKLGILHAVARKDGRECRIDDQKKLILFRIIQEGVQNCLKHAAASELQVNFCYEDNALKVCIKDNGKGFDHQEILQRPIGLGLS
ncbi:MAG TPA: histidine kinase, partial [Puia sp.]